jgi:hypothetical protein
MSGGLPNGFSHGPKTASKHLFGLPLERSGPPPDGPMAEHGSFHRLSFAHKTPSPVNLSLYAYFSNISSHKA